MDNGVDDNQTPSGAQAAAEARRQRRHATRRSRRARSSFVIFLNAVFTLGLVAVIVAGAIFYWGKTQFEGAGPLTAETTFLVPKGGGLQSIANGLERKGIISNARIFEFGVRAERKGGELKAGEYAFAPGASMRDVMETIRSGDAILHAITIPEGWTVAQVYDRLAADPVLVGDLPPLAPEGTLLPDTYNFTRGDTRAAIVKRMSDAQTKLVKEIWDSREEDLPINDIGQFVTLASIVEKETGIASERPHVASVFENRLRAGMRLQSDPTIIYGIWGGAGKPANEPIRQSHIASDTPYNTYVIRGLPPGPIANPGRAALEAVAKPLETEDLYFVADGTGGHAFARTLNEHNANVRKYREIEKRAAAERGQSTEVGASAN